MQEKILEKRCPNARLTECSTFHDQFYSGVKFPARTARNGDRRNVEWPIPVTPVLWQFARCTWWRLRLSSIAVPGCRPAGFPRSGSVASDVQSLRGNQRWADNETICCGLKSAGMWRSASYQNAKPIIVILCRYLLRPRSYNQRTL